MKTLPQVLLQQRYSESKRAISSRLPGQTVFLVFLRINNVSLDLTMVLSLPDK